MISFRLFYSGLLIDCFETIEYFRFRFLVHNRCLFFSRFFFSKESEINCISDCLQGQKRMTKTEIAQKTEARFGLSMPKKPLEQLLF